MVYTFYRMISSLLPFIATLNLLRRSLREPDYRLRIKERFGFVPSTIQKGSIWVHAVSAGEVIAAEMLVNQLLESSNTVHILMTTTTPSGSAEISRRFGNRVDHCYMPYDAKRCIERFLKHTHPRALILMETELWPNLLSIAQRNGTNVCLVNARLSARSAKRYGLVRSLTASMLDSITMIVSQYEDTAERLRNLGYPSERIHVSGNIKFDLVVSEETLRSSARLRERWRLERPCWLAASTHPGEDEIVLDAHLRARARIPDLLTVLAPRHPRRADDIQAMADARSLTSVKLSDPSQSADVLLVDQMGVLLEMCGMVDVAFIGGSLQGTGGHNPVEPAVFGVPMLMGPDRMNFEEVCKRFTDAGCLTTVQNSDELATELLALLNDPDERQRQGDAARQVVNENRGSAQQQFSFVRDWLSATS
ncbi:MAG: lipid IV(A) 3-deoxy-D-manno-octulosonic acid transferase [Gammaproteobacteria bacterium]|nr:lipid IV(A) 3-deoxy-D-manno-octulosonic acid transferase [Gammaproteobacteria bacterium]